MEQSPSPVMAPRAARYLSGRLSGAKAEQRAWAGATTESECVGPAVERGLVRSSVAARVVSESLRCAGRGHVGTPSLPVALLYSGVAAGVVPSCTAPFMQCTNVYQMYFIEHLKFTWPFVGGTRGAKNKIRWI
jgi:hypothetical protein